jgi:copper homeostasis protein
LAVAARKAIDRPIAMLIRARTGLFTASEAEFEVMRQDVIFARDLGMDVVVLGILRDDRTVDVARTRMLVELARPMQVTFHRAFDDTPDMHEALRDILQTGATRILTSGAKALATDGASIVAELRRAAGDSIALMLCGGIGPATVQQSLAISGVSEVHAALRSDVHVEPETGVISQAGLVHFSEAVSRLKREITEAEKALRRASL